MPMKKAALIAALEHEWRSIKADLSEAARNGLKAAAHAGMHGNWDKARAREWAISEARLGKLHKHFNRRFGLELSHGTGPRPSD